LAFLAAIHDMANNNNAAQVAQTEIIEITKQRLKVEPGKLALPGLDKKELASVTQQLVRLQESAIATVPLPGKGGGGKGKKGKALRMLPPLPS